MYIHFTVTRLYQGCSVTRFNGCETNQSIQNKSSTLVESGMKIRILSQGEERETNKMQLIRCLLSNFYLNIFQASLCPSSGEQDLYYRIWCSALVVLAVVVWSCVVSCVHCVKVTVRHSAHSSRRSSTQPQPTTASTTSAEYHMR